MNLKVIRDGRPADSTLPAEELAAINAYAKTALTPEEVYTFSLILCDNEVDRDGERFTLRTLEELRGLFVGKTGIADHDWRAARQKSRIYRTELITDSARQTTAGETYTALKAYAYMLRTDSNAELIAEIEAGIKKEVSVGCAVARTLCSVCGEELGSDACGHVKGETYGGEICHALLDGAVDAYEWSFVAVPAQREAGVTKALGGKGGLKQFVKTPAGAPYAGEYAELTKSAALGKRYLSELRAEVLRLCLLCDEGLYPALSKASETMDSDTLAALRQHYETKSAALYPPATQLPGKRETTRFDGAAFQI